MELRFSSAIDFVVQYAENISAGGLFVLDAVKLEPLSMVEVTLILPGRGEHIVTAKVAHILDKNIAEKVGLPPGAGLEIVKTEPNFQSALSNYLMILGQRKEKVVYVVGKDLCKQIQNSGYNAFEYDQENSKEAMAVVVSDENFEISQALCATKVVAQNVDEALHKLDAILDRKN